ncbi:MAG: hypothetical protein RMK20_02735 [Verrucomicrobiales bacterium]|nr:hypothetical protein [Verrucomicrobiales bacterium]
MNRAESKLVSPISRRRFLRDATVLAGGAAVAPLASHPRFAAASTGGAPAEMNLSKSSAGGMTIIEFERELKRMRLQHYRHPPVDILKEGFRPVGGKIADFAVARLNGRDHFLYIERRLQEATPFYPGHEIYFGHASTPDFFHWEVHDPVLLVREDSWEEAHVWAPVILPEGREFIMAYTGLNRHLSQDIGLASSRDLFRWRRWRSNPISPCKGARWAAWWEDEICSCRDPHLFRHEGRVWMAYTANTREGATCIALASTRDWRRWQDHGPIIVGPTRGYEPKLGGGHAQGSFESAHITWRCGRWLLICKAPNRDPRARTWAGASDRLGGFRMEQMWPFWKDGICVEVVRDHGTRSLIAGMVAGHLKFAEVDWAEDQPAARPITDAATLRWWQSV